MKILPAIILLCISLLCFGQGKGPLNITVDDKNSTYFDKKDKPYIDSAFVIMDSVFNSKDFQSLFVNIDFPCWNLCDVPNCTAGKKCDTAKRITGKTVIDSLLRETNVMMKVELKKSSSKRWEKRVLKHIISLRIMRI